MSKGSTRTPFNCDLNHVLCSMGESLKSWLLLVLIGTIWGSSFILMKKGLVVFEDTQIAAMRMGLAWLVTLPFLLGRFKEVSKKEWLVLLSVGLLGNGLPAFLFATAQTKIDSSLAGMLNSLVPILTMVFGLLMFGLRTWLKQVIGLVIGFLGALLLIVMPGGIDGFQPAALLIVAASMCYAFNLNVVRKYLSKMPSMLITAGSFLWVGPFCLVYLFSTDFITRFDHEFAMQSFGAIVILAVVGTTIAVLMFNKLIQSGGAVFASMVTYIVPVVAILWGVLDGESISPWSVIGVAVILGGVYLVNKPSPT
ncbi:MAG: drug/metabolite transporter (DMT)-like permease [Psychroserpens sp.]|jgi:drug/metabolite transporter (DMT)-like permease